MRTVEMHEYQHLSSRNKWSYLLFVTLERHRDAIAGDGVVSRALELIVEAVITVAILLVRSVSAIILPVT